MTYYKSQIMGVLSESKSQTFHNSFVVINCVTIFIMIRLLLEKRKISGIVQKVVLSVGSCTFGIYLWHLGWIKGGWFKTSLKWLQGTGLNDMICILLMCLMTMIISYIITLVLSKIPVVKKIVGF